MKKLFYLFTAAAFIFAACDPAEEPTPEPIPDPEPAVKAFEVTPATISVKAEDGSATITVTGEVAWTAQSDNSAFSISPASGNGNGTIAVSFPQNTAETEVKANIIVATTDNAETKSFKVAITQAAAEKQQNPGSDTNMPKEAAAAGVVAEWEFCEANLEFFNQTFKYEDAKITDDTGTKVPNPEANKEGYLSENHYCPSNVIEGGKIRFYNGSDKTALNPDGRCKRGSGNAGEPCWYGNWKGDRVEITVEPSGYVDAGKTVHLYLPLRPNTQNTLKYWLLEIKDGENWEPLGEVKTATVDGAEVKYNVELIYNPAGSSEITVDAAGNDVYPENPQQINTIVDQDYTMKNKTWPIEYRMTCQAMLIADGTMVVTYIGETSAAKKQNPVLRIAGKDTTNGGCIPVGKNMSVEIK